MKKGTTKTLLIMSFIVLAIPLYARGYVPEDIFRQKLSSAQLLTPYEHHVCKGAVDSLRVPNAYNANIYHYQWKSTSGLSSLLDTGSTFVTDAIVDNRLVLLEIYDTLNSVVAQRYYAIYVNPVYNDTVVANACDYFSWPTNGEMYTHSTMTTFHGLTEMGCDSLITLNLSLNHSHRLDTVGVGCDSFDWRGLHCTSSGQYTYTYDGDGLCSDSIVLNLTIKTSTTGDTMAVACDSFYWWNTNYTNSTNEATHTMTNAAGCDSTVTLHLTIRHSSSSNESIVACDSFSWWNTNYTSSTNEATHVMRNADGCDSVIHLNLTVNHSSFGDTNVVACNSFSWWNTNYTNSTNEATHVTTNAEGCDSTVTLHLTIHYSTTGIESVTACDSTSWHGTKYYASTDIPQHMIIGGNGYGCDSTVSLHLTLYHSIHQSFNAVACDQYIWDRSNDNYTQSGVYTHSYFSQDGCQSVDTLHLTIYESTSGIDIQEHCDSFTWIDGITYNASNNSPQFMLRNHHGCDSTVTLNLTIHYSSQTDSLLSVHSCDSYSWPANGVTYYISGVYVYETTDIYGCALTKTLDLTIKNSSHNVINEAVCEKYKWERMNITFFESVDTVLRYTNSDGCPSTDTLHLTVYGHQVPAVRELKRKCHKGSSTPWMLIYPRNNDEEDYYYQWYNNGNPVQGANKQYFELGNHGGNDTVTYSVWVASKEMSACASFSTATVVFGQDKAPEMTMYPNPAVDHFNVFIQAEDFKAVRMDVYSESGRLVLSLPMNDNSVDINKKLPSGVYILQAISADGNRVIDKMVIVSNR